MISVVIPTYNASSFIEKTLMSIKNQTMQPYEIIVVDDCSKDDTVDKVSFISKERNMNIQIIRKENRSGGPSEPINMGVEQAKAGYISLLDHDDEMMPERLKISMDTLLSYKEIDLLLCAGLKTDAGTVSPKGSILKIDSEASIQNIKDNLYKVSSKDAYNYLTQKNIIASCSGIIFRKNWWKKVGGFDRLFITCCDYRFLQSITRYVDAWILDQVLYRFNRNGSTLYSQASNLIKTKELFRLFNCFDKDYLFEDQRKHVSAKKKQLIRRVLEYYAKEFSNKLKAYGKS